MEISYKLEHFEGPLDLLLHLIEKNKINIYDIPIVEITEQYLDYVNHMEKEDLNVVSEFLVMAATLLDIKARMLLPAEVDEETEKNRIPVRNWLPVCWNIRNTNIWLWCFRIGRMTPALFFTRIPLFQKKWRNMNRQWI